LDSLRAASCNSPDLGTAATPAGCVPPTMAPPGPCQQPLFAGKVAVGERCTTPIYECQPDLACRTIASGIEGTCAQRGAIGAYCFTDFECTTGLYCSLADGTCQAPRKLGESCAYADASERSPDPSTALTKCDATLSCDPASQTCV